MADARHRAARIAISLARSPGIELAGEIGRRLSRERRVAGIAVPIGTMATGAGCDRVRGIAEVVQPRGGAIDGSCGRGVFGGDGGRQSGVVVGDSVPRLQRELPSDPFHLGVPARAGSIVLELTQRMAGIDPGQARRERTIALARQPMTSGAGGCRAGFAAAESDQFAGGFEGIGAGPGRGTARQRNQQSGTGGKESQRHALVQSAAPSRGSLRMDARAVAAVVMLAALLAGCKQPPDDRYASEADAAERGRALVIAAGCAACHTFPGVRWPQGRVGPSLVGYAGRGPIAGALPNTPAHLAAFVRNARAAKPGSTMPAMPLTEEEARDVAAYLYGLADD